MNKLQLWLGHLGARFKALTALKFPSSQWNWSWPTRSGGLNYGSVGDGSGNSAVVACLEWVAKTFPEAPLQVMRRAGDGEWEPVHDHPLSALLANPNPYYSGISLWQATLTDRTIGGNAYWLRRRSGSGKPIELWWLPAWLVEPKRRDGAEEFITHYEYRPTGTEVIPYEPHEIVHFRNGFDPDNPMKGRSPLRAALPEVFTDEEAGRFSAALLANLGVPGVIISPKDSAAAITADQAADLKMNFMQKFGGERRGEPLVSQGGLDVSVLSFSPEQMDLKGLRRLPEERICAVLGIPPMVVGLGAGLERSTFANMAEAREAAYESNIIPTQRLFVAELNTQLLPDFGDPRRERVAFDLSQVRVLQDDQDKLYARVTRAVQVGWLTVADARRAANLPVLDSDDVYLLPANVVVTPVAELGVPVEAPAPTLQFPPALALASLPRPEIKLLETKADDPATDELLAAIEALRDRLEPPMLAAVAAFLGAQAERIGGRLGTSATILSLYPQTEGALLRELLDPWYRTVLAGLQAPAQATLGVTWGIEDSRVLEYLSRAGTQIRGIDETTFQAVARLLQEGRAAGMTPVQIAQQMREDFAFSASRAETITRTELANASNNAAMAHYQASGVVVGVRVFDGDYDSVCAAMNGRVFTLAEAGSLPRIAHPRCRRAFAPLTDAAALQRTA